MTTVVGGTKVVDGTKAQRRKRLTKDTFRHKVPPRGASLFHSVLEDSADD